MISITAPLHTNTHTMHGLLNANIMSHSPIPEMVSAWQNTSCIKKIWLFSSDWSGAVSLSDLRKSSGTGYACPHNLFLHWQGSVLRQKCRFKAYKPKFKPRKCHKTQITDRSVFVNRTYLDFQSLNLEYFSEMDTVHSSRESKKTLLTFYITKEKLFLAFLMNRCTKVAVRLVFDHLEKRLGNYEFVSLFEYVLTDRGSEFGDPVGLETGISEIQRCNLYYCDTMRRDNIVTSIPRSLKLSFWSSKISLLTFTYSPWVLFFKTAKKSLLSIEKRRWLC